MKKVICFLNKKNINFTKTSFLFACSGMDSQRGGKGRDEGAHRPQSRDEAGEDARAAADSKTVAVLLLQNAAHLAAGGHLDVELKLEFFVAVAAAAAATAPSTSISGYRRY